MSSLRQLAVTPDIATTTPGTNIAHTEHAAEPQAELVAAGQPIASTTALQRTMVEDGIKRRLEIRVWRNGALVDVIAVPRELSDA